MPRILVVDDDDFMRDSLLDTLRESGYDVAACAAAPAALEHLNAERWDVAISDLKMPGMSGLEFLAEARRLDASLPVLLITAHGTVETAVAAMKQGAFDYILKPFGADELRILVTKALEHRRLVEENEALRGELRRRDEDTPLLGDSASLRRVLDLISMVAAAPGDPTVLIRGETGVGKELVARAIHYQSPRAERPFVCVNCAALSAGLLESELFGHEKGAFTGADRARAGRFEVAQGGTLLLDEVSEIDIQLQAKLLRVLQEKKFERVGSSKSITADVRVLATTNRDLEREVREGGFREDLYYRLNVVPVEIPPLRDRKDDIRLLAHHFLERAERRAGGTVRPLSAVSERQMLAYSWPGNVRELENLIERAVLLSTGDEVVLEGLAGGAPTRRPEDPGRLRGLSLEEIEKLMIVDTLRMHAGRQKPTAASLGIGERTLRDKIKKWGVKIERGEVLVT